MTAIARTASVDRLLEQRWSADRECA